MTPKIAAKPTSATPETPPSRPVLAWAQDKAISAFVLAGALVKAGWPRGNVYDERAPLLVTEEEFDAAVAAFSNMKVK
jgi:hypothetical protein